MNPKRASDCQDETTPTLADLLYADHSGTSIPENDRVRLVESIAGGDQHALRALYERTHRIVFTLVMRICRNREIAEELTPDVFHDVGGGPANTIRKVGSVVGRIMIQAWSRAIDLGHAPYGTVVDAEHAEYARDRDRLRRAHGGHATRRYALPEPWRARTSETGSPRRVMSRNGRLRDSLGGCEACAREQEEPSARARHPGEHAP